MLWGRIYAIWDPLLAQAALRSRAFSFDPFIVDFVKKAFSLRRETFAKINDEMLADFNDGIHAGMKTSFVLKMNANALNFVSKNFDGIREDRLEIPNLYLWLRDLVSLATTRALFGKENPFEKDPGLLDDMW
jgi:hypothetical protein